MAMTIDDKQRCSDVYEAYTGISIPANKWNEVAAEYLAEMVTEIVTCSRGMGATRSILPKTVKPTWSWLVGIPYHIIMNEIRLKKGYVNVACLNSKTGQYRALIEGAIITGK